MAEWLTRGCVGGGEEEGADLTTVAETLVEVREPPKLVVALPLIPPTPVLVGDVVVIVVVARGLG